MVLRKYTVVITILLCMACALTRAQTQEQRDSIVHAVCVELTSSTDLPDSTRIISAYEKHLYPFVMKYDERTHREIITNVHYRLQRNCREFAIILDRLEENYGDWAFVESKPATSLNKKTCRGFMRHKKYSYLEASGERVNVVVDGGYWYESFPDGTYSRCAFKWVTDCEFELEFIESDNRSRKNFSTRGDRYRYQILNQEDNFYLMSAEIVGKDGFVTFKIYY